MIKFGYINFWSDDLDDFLREAYIAPIKELGYEVDENFYDPTKTEVDVVFHSVFRQPSNLLKVKGNPLFVCYSGENRLDYYMIRGGISLSFRQDSENNIYYPIWADCYSNLKYRRPLQELKDKTKFCTFVISNGNFWWRNLVFEYLSSNYKCIDSCGTRLNNMSDGFILPRDMTEAVDFHRPYKFNLCFENSEDETVDTNYITEKIVNAYVYGTVPIYWGSASVSKWLNEDAFINCKGKSVFEILEEVKFYDKNSEAYFKKLSQPLFKTDTDWHEWNRERFKNFFKKKFEEHLTKNEK